MKRAKLSDRRPEQHDTLRYFMEAFAQAAAERDVAAMIAVAYSRAIKTNEPINPDLKQWLADQLPGGPANPASKLLDAIPVIRSAKKRAGTLKEVHIEAAEKKERAALTIANRLQMEKPRLRLAGKKRLAELVRNEFPQPKKGKKPSVRTIRRWIAKALAEQR